MLFKYKSLDKQGQKQSGAIDAADQIEATIKLKQKGLFVQSLKAQKEPIFGKFLQKKEKIKPIDLANISKDLSIYLNAGISIVAAINLAITQHKNNKKIKAFLESISTLLDEGKSLALALEAQSIFALPNFFVQSIKVSENGGILSLVLDEMSRFIKNNENTKKQVRSSMFYPVFILIVAIVMVAMMIVFIVPKITSLFEETSQELPAITKFVIGFSDFLSSNWLLILGFVFIAVFSLSLLFRFNIKFKFFVHTLLLKIPFFSRIIIVNELGRFSYMMGVLVKSGVSFVQGISLCANILDNLVIKNIFLQAAQKVIEGKKLSNSINSKLIDDSFVQALALGEETSQVQQILSNISLVYFEENDYKIKVFLSLLEPMLMLFVGGVVGFIVLAMLLPIFSMNVG